MLFAIKVNVVNAEIFYSQEKQYFTNSIVKQMTQNYIHYYYQIGIQANLMLISGNRLSMSQISGSVHFTCLRLVVFYNVYLNDSVPLSKQSRFLPMLSESPAALSV